MFTASLKRLPIQGVVGEGTHAFVPDPVMAMQK